MFVGIAIGVSERAIDLTRRYQANTGFRMAQGEGCRGAGALTGLLCIVTGFRYLVCNKVTGIDLVSKFGSTGCGKVSILEFLGEYFFSKISSKYGGVY